VVYAARRPQSRHPGPRPLRRRGGTLPMDRAMLMIVSAGLLLAGVIGLVFGG
jgi:hypothetical protein